MRRSSVLVACIAFALTLFGAFLTPDRSAFAYLAAWMCGLTLALGALLMIMIAHVTSASWFLPMRRIAESIAGTLPLLALLFLPILIARARLYPWARPLEMLSEPMREAVLAKPTYLGTPFFTLRAAIYFTIWIVVAALLGSWSAQQDRHPDPGLVSRERILSALGLPPVAFALTFASFDWIMSLDPRWISTMFGIYNFAGGIVAALGAIALLSHLLGPGILEMSRSHLHALGKLLLTFVIFWGYIAYAQYFIIWIADIPDEAGWYLPRLRGGWGGIAAALAIAHFVIPFLFLLSWRWKRETAPMAFIGVWLIGAHILDLYWLVIPALAPDSALLHWVDLIALVGIGAAMLAFGIWRFEQQLPVPLHDPRWARAREYTTR